MRALFAGLFVFSLVASGAVAQPAPTWPVIHGIALRFLTTGEVMDDWPCFSPDGKTVVFARSVSLGKNWTDWTLRRIPSAGGVAQGLGKEPLPIVATRANWSAKGLIAFTGTSTPDRKSGIWIVNGDGSNPHAVIVADTPHDLIYPSWYPDGNSVAVMDDDTDMVRRLDLAYGTTAPLTDPALVYSGMASVSPDGSTVVFAGQKNEGQTYNQSKNVIWLVGDGKTAPLEANPGQGRSPAWSPDGRKIVFESDRGDAHGRYAIFLINSDGSGLTQVTDFALNASHPVFSRDGRHLVISYEAVGTKGRGIALLDLP